MSNISLHVIDIWTYFRNVLLVNHIDKTASIFMVNQYLLSYTAQYCAKKIKIIYNLSENRVSVEIFFYNFDAHKRNRTFKCSLAVGVWGSYICCAIVCEIIGKNVAINAERTYSSLFDPGPKWSVKSAKFTIKKQ